MRCSTLCIARGAFRSRWTVDRVDSNDMPESWGPGPDPGGQKPRNGFLASRRAAWRKMMDLGGSSFVGHSATIFVGFSLASLLGFVFSVVSARLLQPSEFGTMQYALAIAELAGV